MKFTVEQKRLNLAVKAINKCLNKKPHLPILGGIQLTVKANELELTTVDLTATLKVRIAATVEEEGMVVVSGKNFIEAVGFFDGLETKCSVSEKEMLVVNGRDKVKIPLMTDEMPEFRMDKMPADKKMSVNFWEEIVKRVAFAASSDESRPALTGILLKDNAEKTQIVCTDGFRLAIWQADKKLELDGENQAIVSAKAVSDMVGLSVILEETRVGFAYDKENEQMVFAGESFVYGTKVINSNYPPFEKIVPLEFTTEVVLEREELIRNLGKASVFTKADSNTVKITIGKDLVVYDAVSMGEGSFHGEQEVVKESGEGLEISFNIKYLLEFLATQESTTIWIGCNGPTSPAMIRDPKNTQLEYVVMPFKPKG